METNRVRERDQETSPKSTRGSDPLQLPELEPDQGPRVVDRRRFLHLLDEDVSTTEPVEEEPRFPSFVEELQSKLKASEERLLDYAEKVRQARQDMETEVNDIRQRLQRSMESQLEQNKARFIGNLLEVFDNLNRAIQSAEATKSFEGLMAGIKATISVFERILEVENVSQIDPQGEPFDPRFHEAIEIVSVEPERDNLVIDVLQTGYKLGQETLIRPAQVSVGQTTTDSGDPRQEDAQAPKA